MLSNNQIAVLRAVHAMNNVSGYNPTIGEVAKVANVSKGVATRSLEKLCGLGFVTCHKMRTKKPRYSFQIIFAGLDFLISKGLL